MQVIDVDFDNDDRDVSDELRRYDELQAWIDAAE
jgi:hypothetical protein